LINEYIFDNRSARKASNDYRIGKENEVKAIDALVDYYIARGIVCSYRPIDPNEGWLDGSYHAYPDFYFFKGESEIFTVEVKFSTTGNFNNDMIFVKPNPFWTSNKDQSRFPNFLTLVATDHNFTIIKAAEFTKDKLQVAEEWSTADFKKKVYKFTINRKWLNWVTEIE